MRLCLAAMPWLALDTPSLPVGILRRRLREVCPSVEVREYHGGVRWAEHLLEATGGELSPRHYMQIACQGLGYGLGDWIFAGALYGDVNWRVAALRRHAERWDFDIELAERMRQFADAFVAGAAEDVLSGDPDVVGFTTTFMQTVPSLALARELKRRKPDLRVVFGGANCDGPMGHALHRNHRFVDFVVRGEGEVAFPSLLKHISARTPPRDVPGACWWDANGSVANPETTWTVPPDLIPTPDFDEWFAVLASSPISEHLSPYVFIEGSRGCWWGERHHCTFCGLNDSLITFRSKPAERFWNELSYLVERHRVLDIMAADNIMDMAYYRDLLPRLKACDWDLRMHYEVKANVQADQIALLAEAGACAVQYGIESLSSRVLRLMDKGLTAGTNIRVLRDSEDHHVTVKWNYLCGFPGESAEDYHCVIEQMPALVHLQPPSGAVRIELERFSPYFERPELGFLRRRPREFYRYIYDLPESELADLAFFFEADDQGISPNLQRVLANAIDNWRRDYPHSSLFRIDGPDDALTVCDRRQGWATRDHVLTGWKHTAYVGLDRARTAESTHRYLAEHGHQVDLDRVRDWLVACLRDGLVFADGDTYVALATRDVAIRASPARQATADTYADAR